MVIQIGKAVGRGGVNDLADVQTIAKALNRVLAESKAVPTDTEKKSIDALISRIEKFQKSFFRRVDGNVGPNGATIKRMRKVATPLTIGSVSMGKIRHGGYVLSASGYLAPRDYAVLLGTSVRNGEFLDVTARFRRRRTDLLTKQNLGALLAMINEKKAWGAKLEVRLFVTRDGKEVTKSALRQLTCPVEPINDSLLPLDTKSNGPKMPYQGDAKSKTFWGRLLTRVPGFDRSLFTWAGKFETDKVFRGFDCITYCAAVLGVPPNVALSNADALLAAFAHEECYIRDAKKKGAVATKLRNVRAGAIRTYFFKSKNGYYLLWKGSHTVMVFAGQVHEFSASKKGYAVSPVGDWLAKQKGKLSLVKVTGAPARA